VGVAKKGVRLRPDDRAAAGSDRRMVLRRVEVVVLLLHGAYS